MNACQLLVYILFVDSRSPFSFSSRYYFFNKSLWVPISVVFFLRYESTCDEMRLSAEASDFKVFFSLPVALAALKIKKVVDRTNQKVSAEK